jgi:UDP-N-acetylglucosamine 2-epimerase (non-hydrolysing)
MMLQLERTFTTQSITDVIVFGDVNATLAGALTAQKMGLRLIHVEAGLRSYNYQMPEETNRILTDMVADILFATSEDAAENLKREKVRGTILNVGNIMIDNLLYYSQRVPVVDEKFYFCTLHRAENVDNREIFSNIISALSAIKDKSGLQIYLPLHPRTRKQAEQFGLFARLANVCTLVEPLPYLKTLYYEKNAQLILTDSGGIQEEASILGVPCLTLRTETERPITVEQGTNTIAGISQESIMKAYDSVVYGRRQVTIPLWDGQAAERIITAIQSL